MTLTQTLIATAVALCAVQALALTWSIAAGGYSTQAGARHETFDDVATDANEALDMSYAGGCSTTASAASARDRRARSATSCR